MSTRPQILVASYDPPGVGDEPPIQGSLPEAIVATHASPCMSADFGDALREFAARVGTRHDEQAR